MNRPDAFQRIKMKCKLQTQHRKALCQVLSILAGTHNREHKWKSWIYILLRAMQRCGSRGIRSAYHGWPAGSPGGTNL